MQTNRLTQERFMGGIPHIETPQRPETISKRADQKKTERKRKHIPAVNGNRSLEVDYYSNSPGIRPQDRHGVGIAHGQFYNCRWYVREDAALSRLPFESRRSINRSGTELVYLAICRCLTQLWELSSDSQTEYECWNRIGPVKGL